MLSNATARIHKQDLESVVASVFSTMMGVDVGPSDAPCPEPAGLLTAAVYLTGAWQGAVFIHCYPQQAGDFAGRFLGMPPPQSVDNDVRDVMGELANMVAGNLKCTFSAGIRVSIPSVTDGPGYSLRVCGAHIVCQTGFDIAGGTIWITLIDTEDIDTVEAR
jgi:chemotaxis protein CheX